MSRKRNLDKMFGRVRTLGMAVQLDREGSVLNSCVGAPGSLIARSSVTISPDAYSDTGQLKSSSGARDPTELSAPDGADNSEFDIPAVERIDEDEQEEPVSAEAKTDGDNDISGAVSDVQRMLSFDQYDSVKNSIQATLKTLADAFVAASQCLEDLDLDAVKRESDANVQQIIMFMGDHQLSDSDAVSVYKMLHSELNRKKRIDSMTSVLAQMSEAVHALKDGMSGFRL